MKERDKAIREYIESNEKYKPNERIKRLGHLLYWDLHYGPITGCDVCGVDHTSECTCEVKWPGFEKACKEVRAWFEELPTLYYTEDLEEVSETEPTYELCCEEDDHEEHSNFCYVEPSSYYEIEPKEIVRYFFGSHVSEYL